MEVSVLFDGYWLFSKEEKSCLVLSTDDQDELHYLVGKLIRSKNKSLKDLGKNLQIELNKFKN